MGDGQCLAAALQARLRVEESAAESNRAEQSTLRALGSTREGERDSARELLNEVKRQTLLLELAAEQRRKAAIDEELQEVVLELSGWETLPLVAERELAISTAKGLAEQVAAADEDAAPALERRDLTAGRLLAKFDEAAGAADDAAQTHLDQAADAGEQADAADLERGTALGLAAEACERHRALQQLISDAVARIENAAGIDLVPRQTRIVDLPDVVLEAAESHCQAEIKAVADKEVVGLLSTSAKSLEPRVARRSSVLSKLRRPRIRRLATSRSRTGRLAVRTHFRRSPQRSEHTTTF